VSDSTGLHGFVFEQGVFTALNGPGGIPAIPVGINDRGQIVGATGGHGFVVDQGGFNLLDVPFPDARSESTVVGGINNTGQLVGFYADERGVVRGFSAMPLPPLVNDWVNLVTLSSTFRTVTDTTGCPAGFVGKFTFTARLTDKLTSPPLTSLGVRVNTLTNDNVLLDPQTNVPLGGAGAVMQVPEVEQYADGLRSPNKEESKGQAGTLCVCRRQSGVASEAGAFQDSEEIFQCGSGPSLLAGLLFS
jgi:hypothetical protein